MDSKWLNDDDYEQDLYEISDFCTAAPISPVTATKPNVHVRRARAKPSMYEEDLTSEDTVSQPPSAIGRGRSTSQEFLQYQKQISKDIRMANSFGYHNDTILHKFQPTELLPFNSSRCKSPTSTNGSHSSSSDDAPIPLYDLIKGKSATKSDVNGTETNSLPNINSYKDFPKL